MGYKEKCLFKKGKGKEKNIQGLFEGFVYHLYIMKVLYQIPTCHYYMYINIHILCLKLDKFIILWFSL